jgi:hypothetical protein
MLDKLCGYGYSLLNITVVYLVVLVLFAVIYWALGVHSHSPEPGWQALWDSFLISLYQSIRDTWPHRL